MGAPVLGQGKVSSGAPAAALLPRMNAAMACCWVGLGEGSGGGLGVGACFVGRAGACVVLVIREIPDTCLSITWFR